MSSKFKAVDDIKKLGKFLSGIAEFAQELEQVASLEQAAKEAEKNIEKMKAQALEAEAELGSVVKNLREAKELFESEKADLKAKAEQMSIDASVKAKEILSEAQSEALKISQAAKEELLKSKAELEILKQQKQEVERERDFAKASLADINVAINAIKGKLG